MQHELTYRQRRFINYFIEYGNGSLSAIKAGYAKKSARQTANRLITNNYIQKALAAKFHYMSDHAIANAEEIYKFYTNVLRGNVYEDVVLSTADGEVKDKRPPMISDRLTASRELMKRYAPIENAKARKINAEAKIKEYAAKHLGSADAVAVSKLDRLLNLMFDNSHHDNNDDRKDDNANG